MTMYGYARVSSDGQCLDAQQEALAAAGAAKVFAEKLSGASAANRTDLAKLLATFRRKIRRGFAGARICEKPEICKV
jgi:DNA invertase Pin-like site-specific DNA recombinase